MGVAVGSALKDDPVLNYLKETTRLGDIARKEEEAEELARVNSRLHSYKVRIDKFTGDGEIRPTLKALRNMIVFALDCPTVDSFDRTRLCSFAKSMVIMYEDGLDDSEHTLNRHWCIHHYSKMLEIRPGFALNMLKLHYLADIDALSGDGLVKRNPEMVTFVTEMYSFSGFLLSKSKDWNKKSVSYTISGGYESSKIACITIPEKSQEAAPDIAKRATWFFSLLNQAGLLKTATSEKRFLRFRLMKRKRNIPHIHYYIGMGRFRLDIGKLT